MVSSSGQAFLQRRADAGLAGWAISETARARAQGRSLFLRETERVQGKRACAEGHCLCERQRESESLRETERECKECVLVLALTKKRKRATGALSRVLCFNKKKEESDGGIVKSEVAGRDGTGEGVRS